MQTAKDILDCKLKDAALLLGRGEHDIRKSFKALAVKWHPDVNAADPMAGRVFAHLVALRDYALAGGRNTMAGSSGSSGLPSRLYEDETGRSLKLDPLAVHRGDLGEIVVSGNGLLYEFEAQNSDLAEAERHRIEGLTFADAAMEWEFSRFLPKIARSLKRGGGDVHVMKRPADTVLLADLLSVNPKQEAVHVAWMVSSMLNLACYVQWAGLVHGAFSAENILVSPKKHSIILAGGWAFATAIDARPKGLPQRTLAIMPRLAIGGQVVTTQTDLELIRALAQDMLGRPGGSGLCSDSTVPAPMADWLMRPAGDDAFEDYVAWGDALDKSFGKRRFVEMRMTPEEIYQQRR